VTLASFGRVVPASFARAGPPSGYDEMVGQRRQSRLGPPYQLMKVVDKVRSSN